MKAAAKGKTKILQWRKKKSFPPFVEWLQILPFHNDVLQGTAPWAVSHIFKVWT